MLAIKDIASIIQSPTKCGKESITQLKEFTIKYPYSSLFSILYLKALSNTSNIHFEEELLQHSFRISDREQLYNLIQQHSDLKENLSIQNEIEDAIEDKITKKPTEKIPLKEEGIQGSEIESIEKEPEITPDVKTPSLSEKVTDVVEESILQHAFSVNYKLPELNEKEIVELNEKNISIKKKEEISTEKVKLEITIDTKQSFKSWLASNKNYEQTKNSNKPSIPTINKDTEPLKTKKELLEEVKKPKKAFFSPIQKAKESLNEDVLPVSETLAKIYALQGNFPKAISAYMQLSLINPEKKIFFALRIKELEQKLKHK